MSSRAAAVIESLRSAGRPLTGPELAARLRVSTRTIRTYIAQLNADGTVVVSGANGYALLHSASRQTGMLHAASERAQSAPDERLTVLARSLVQSTSPVSVHALAERMSVSDATVEADLGRARLVMREHDLRVVRDHEFVHVEGPERGKRRLMRQLVFASNDGLIPAAWKALIREYTDVDVLALREAVERTLEQTNVVLNEFTFNDVLLHLTVTLDRVRHGHVLPRPADQVGDVDDTLMELSRRLMHAVEALCPVDIPDSEIAGLYSVLIVRNVLGAHAGARTSTVDPAVHELVTGILDEVSAKYLLGPAEQKVRLNLALHVQGLLARARSRVPVPRPLGDDFKSSHPLLHDLAVDFAGRLEHRTGAAVSPSEIDYLTLHMGMQYQQYFEERDLLTVTLVVPRYYEIGTSLAERIRDAIRGQGVVETIATTIDFDFSAVTSDLIVSTVPASTPPAAPLVQVSALLSRDDLDRVVAAVRRERALAIRRRIRSTLSALIDPELFVRVAAPTSRDEALTTLADRLHSAEYTGGHFLADVLDREERSSTAFDGGFAIPHSMNMDARATAIAPLISEQPIAWGESRVRLVLLFALSPEGRQAFSDVLDEVTRLLSDGRHLAELIAAGTDAETFIQTFMDLLDRDQAE